jgi:hypothetical protein
MDLGVSIVGHRRASLDTIADLNSEPAPSEAPYKSAARPKALPLKAAESSLWAPRHSRLVRILKICETLIAAKASFELMHRSKQPL